MDKAQVNPFEVKFSRSKIKTANENAKRNRSLPGHTKTKSIEERKNTLAQEYIRKNKTNQFKDRRNGTKRKIKTDDYSADYDNDDDGQEEMTLLTHNGRDVSKIDNHIHVSEDDEEDENALNESYTKQAHFGDGQNPVDQKSAVKNLIIESKKRKAEKAKEAEILLSMTQTLDQQWKTVIPIVKQLVDKDDERVKPDDYDRIMKEMIFERRGEPTKKLQPQQEVMRSADDLDDDDYAIEDVEAEDDEEASEGETEDEEEENEVPIQKPAVVITEDDKIVPKTYDEFQAKIQGHGDGQAVLVRMWIRGLEAAPQTKQKNQASMLAYLLQFIDDAFDEGQDVTAAFRVVGTMMEFLQHLTKQQPELGIKCLKAILEQKQESFEEDSTRWPGMDTLVLFKVLFDLFPADSTKSFKNPLHIATFAFISQIFTSCKVTHRSEISRALFLLSLVAAFAEQTERFLFQSLLVLYNLLFAATTIDFRSPLTRDCDRILAPEPTEQKIKVYKLVAADLTIQSIDVGFKLRALSVSIGLVQQLAQMPCTNIKFYGRHFSVCLNNIGLSEGLPMKIRKQLAAALDQLATDQAAELKYVAQEKKVPMLKMLEPKIEKCFDPQPNMQRKDYYRKSDKQALMNKIKRERKGAIREIRKDNNFIAKMKLKNRMEGDRIRKEKVKQIFAHAAGESSEFKKKKKK